MSIQLRGGHKTDDIKLDRIPPSDWEHVNKYPLSSEMAAALPPTPVVIGVNWYSAFDRPEKDSAGHWWIARNGKLGSMRGGHCVCLKPRHVTDPTTWWDYYNQGQEGRCVQFGVSRTMSLLNRRQYEIREDVTQGRWLYFQAQMNDEWEGGSYPGATPVYEGTSVRSALEIVKDHGIIRKGKWAPLMADGISAYRWIRSIDDLMEVLGYKDVGYVDILNSWGRDYPHLVRTPVEVMKRLWDEDGEFGVVTDR